MTTRRLSGLARAGLSFIAALALWGCDSDSGERTPVTDFDGRYNLTYISEGQIAAIADAELREGALYGRVVNAEGIVFAVGGTVDESGVINYESIQTSNNSDVVAQGMVNLDGTTDGTYSVLDRQGIYYGFRYSDLDALATEYDGDYRLQFFLGALQLTTATAAIRDGWFSFTLDIGQGINIEGSVLEGGNIVARTRAGDLGSGIVSTAMIEGDTVVGRFFTIDGVRGTVSGQRI